MELCLRWTSEPEAITWPGPWRFRVRHVLSGLPHAYFFFFNTDLISDRTKLLPLMCWHHSLEDRTAKRCDTTSLLKRANKLLTLLRRSQKCSQQGPDGSTPKYPVHQCVIKSLGIQLYFFLRWKWPAKLSGNHRSLSPSQHVRPEQAGQGPAVEVILIWCGWLEARTGYVEDRHGRVGKKCGELEGEKNKDKSADWSKRMVWNRRKSETNKRSHKEEECTKMCLNMKINLIWTSY